MREIKTNVPVVYISDVRDMEFDFRSHLVVTSPPYWNLKDYGTSDQIGFGQKFSEYINDLCDVFNKCRKSLYPGCRMCINIGDMYLAAEDYDEFRVMPIQAYLITRLVKMNMHYMGAIIWNKAATSHPSGGGTWMGSTYYPKDGHVLHNYEWILVFRKYGESPKPSKIAKEKSRLTRRQRSKWFGGGIWKDIPSVRQEGHPAMFPLKLPYRLIRMFSFFGETVLDPFVGSGTTLKAAKIAGRHGIGIESNTMFIPLIQKRVPEVEIKYEIG